MKWLLLTIFISAEPNTPPGNSINAYDSYKECEEALIKRNNIDEAINGINKLISQKKLFDLIFIDADKENYKKYYELSFNLLKRDGFIIIDNVLWHGEVVDKNNKEHLTEIIRDFNTYVNNDIRVENMIIPIGDGFSICRKL